jgi:hypothetical protein
LNAAWIWKIVRCLVSDPRIFHAREVAVSYPDEELSRVLLGMRSTGLLVWPSWLTMRMPPDQHQTFAA